MSQFQFTTCSTTFNIDSVSLRYYFLSSNVFMESKHLKVLDGILNARCFLIDFLI